MPYQQKHSGFTLLELILVVVLLGVLASGAGLLISTPIEAYNDQLRRQQLVDQAEIALRQIARDVRRALPNSLRVNGAALEMINTVDGARYRDESATGTGAAYDEVLDFTQPDSAFNFLGRLNSLTTLSARHRLVIYNTTDDIYTYAAGGAATGIITPAASLTLSSSSSFDYANEDQITMNPAFHFTQKSPGQRAFIVDGPISYICDTGAGTLMRYSDYDYAAVQPVAAPGTGVNGPVVTQLSACNISYDPGTAQRAGLVTLEITIDDSGESISLLHQVHVINVP